MPHFRSLTLTLTLTLNRLLIRKNLLVTKGIRSGTWSISAMPKKKIVYHLWISGKHALMWWIWRAAIGSLLVLGLVYQLYEYFTRLDLYTNAAAVPDLAPKGSGNISQAESNRPNKIALLFVIQQHFPFEVFWNTSLKLMSGKPTKSTISPRGLRIRCTFIRCLIRNISP